MWETDGSGPARRVYSITDSGEQILQGWTQVVSGYQRMINGYFDLYGQIFGLGNVPNASESETPSTDEQTSRESD